MLKEELVKFWKSSAFGSVYRKFLKYSSALQERAYLHNLAYISRESDRIDGLEILSQYRWTRKSLLNLGSNPDPESIFSLADVCGL